MKKGVIICTLLLFFGLFACGKSETLPASASDSMELESGTENNVPDPEQIQLEGLRKAPSVKKAVIQSKSSPNSTIETSQYTIDLNHNTASVFIQGQETQTYDLSQEQAEDLRRLLSEYALTVYNGRPYWPSGDYCTMEVLFDYTIDYEMGSYREYGATHYPEEWEEFTQSLKELIRKETEEG